MYLDYWGYRRFPFENIPDADFFYLSNTHVEGLSRISYVTQNGKGCALLAGDIGAGKTTIGKVFLNRLSEEKFDPVFISNPCLETTEFLQYLLFKLNVDPVPETKVKILQALEERLISAIDQNKETLLLVDEAQRLSAAILEEIRMLLNSHYKGRYLLNIVLMGQKELIQKIKDLKQFQQRIAAKYYLRPFNLKETAGYMFYRQKQAGGDRNIFTPKAIKTIYRHSGGLPRVINHLADLAILVGASKGKEKISSNIVKSIVDDGTIFFPCDKQPVCGMSHSPV